MRREAETALACPSGAANDPYQNSLTHDFKSLMIQLSEMTICQL